MQRVIHSLFAVLSICLATKHHGSSISDLRSLAQAGRIHDAAPVKAVVQVIADAPPGVVWELLANINGWSRWQPAISKAVALSPIATGSDFDWAIDGNPIHSHIERLDAGHQLAWVSFTVSAQTIHVWTLEAVPGRKTRILSAESMDGAHLPLTSKELCDSDRAWLNALKAAAKGKVGADAQP